MVKLALIVTLLQQKNDKVSINFAAAKMVKLAKILLQQKWPLAAILLQQKKNGQVSINSNFAAAERPIATTLLQQKNDKVSIHFAAAKMVKLTKILLQQKWPLAAILLQKNMAK